jgi:putative solute:sodium symporter small subunit
VQTGVPEPKAYWRKNLTITWLALALWVAVTVLIGLYGREARELTALYAIITGLYGWYLSRQDRFYGC